MKLTKGYLHFSKKYLRLIPEKTRLAWYPPWWMMRIKVLKLENNWRKIHIKLPLTWAAKNMGGSMFGGFQASLADPIAPLACAKVFPEYDVWTRHLSVDFHLLGNSDLELRFNFPKQLEQQITEELNTKGRSTPVFEYGFYRTDGKCCTTISCAVAIRPANYMHPENPSTSS